MEILYRIASHVVMWADYYRIKSYYKSIHGGGYMLGNKLICSYPKNIQIGNGSYVNGGYLLASPNARIIIGDNCLISYDVHIRTDMHCYKNAGIPIIQQGNIEKDIIVEDDVWVGFGAQIMPGVTLRKGSVIGAGGVVTKDTEPYGVYGGVPAKKIGMREERA